MNKLIFSSVLLISQAVFAGGNTGGMDGGGGGTLPAHPASIYQVKQIASEAKPKLLYLLNSYEWINGITSPTPLYKKLFGGPQKAQEVLSHLRLEIRNEKPCLTSQGTEVDGSIYAAKPNTICLSAFRIAPKIDTAIVEREVLALLMHEVSHFLGADEAEATQIQQDIASSILNSGNAKLDEQQILGALNSFQSDLSSTAESLEKADLVQALADLRDAFKGIVHFQTVSSDPTYRLFREQEMAYQNLLNARIIWAIKYLQTLVPGENAGYREIYKQQFGNKNYFLAKEETFDSNGPYAQEKIMKLNSVQELKELIATIRYEYGIRSAYTYQAVYGTHWLNLNGHLTAPASNRWAAFVGTYQVQNVNCDTPSSSAEETQFEVTQANNGNLSFKRTKGSSYFSDLIQFGVYNVNMYLNNYGETKDGGVFMVSEGGGSWSDSFSWESSTVVTQLKKVGTNGFELIKSSSYLPKDITEADQIQTCVYTGTIL